MGRGTTRATVEAMNHPRPTVEVELVTHRLPTNHLPVVGTPDSPHHSGARSYALATQHSRPTLTATQHSRPTLTPTHSLTRCKTECDPPTRARRHRCTAKTRSPEARHDHAPFRAYGHWIVHSHPDRGGRATRDRDGGGARDSVQQASVELTPRHPAVISCGQCAAPPCPERSSPRGGCGLPSRSRRRWPTPWSSWRAAPCREWA